jgi:hypothetical protein
MKPLSEEPFYAPGGGVFAVELCPKEQQFIVAQSTGKVTLFNLNGCTKIAVVNSLDWAKQTVDLFKAKRGQRKNLAALYLKKPDMMRISKRSSQFSSKQSELLERDGAEEEDQVSQDLVFSGAKTTAHRNAGQFLLSEGAEATTASALLSPNMASMDEGRNDAQKRLNSQ